MEGTEQLTWRRSTRSGGGNNDNCVEVATTSHLVLIRDSKDPAGPTLAVTATDWRAFVAGLQM